jgi:formylglycine-generating enzyme required for sulfatase activity
MGAQNQPLYPMLGWQLSVDPDPGDTVTYTVFMGTVYPPATIVSTNQAATQFDPGKLLANIPYFWKVIARDNHEATASSSVWNFATGDPVVPGEMVLIPAGYFQMGCDDGECSWDTVPLHTVYLDYYRIDRYEVTNAEYEECVSAGACSAPYSTGSYTRESNYGNPNYADYPVIEVTWNYASTYYNWAGKRLPTEAEWEKAVRGSSDTRPYPWGEQVPDCTLANIWSCLGDTSPVGNHPAGASPYGVMDMIGNIGEWVFDWYDGGYYSLYPPDAWPPNPTGPDTGYYKRFRGGIFNSVSLAYGDSREPDYYSSFIYLGFRCAAPIDE